MWAWAGAGAALLAISGVALAGWLTRRVEACGPFFPNSLLAAGDDAVLEAPGVFFEAELARMRLEAPRGLPVVPADRGERESTVDAEISDLRRALRDRGLSTNAIAGVVLEFSRVRADLEDHSRALADWQFDRARRGSGQTTDGAGEAIPAPGEESGAATGNGEPARPQWVGSPLSGDVPEEFAVYLNGAVAWHEGRTEAAREVWSGLLARPPGERRYKSVWAAFMLGRSWHEEDPSKAEAWYERVRKQVRGGLPDSAGLGVASLGWQAQLRLRTNDLAGALRLYSDQYAAGGRGAALSLGVAARRVVDASPETRLAIAQVPLFRGLVTAWVLSQARSSRRWFENDGENGPADPPSGAGTPGRLWLETVEASGAAEVPLAEQLAVLAYQVGDWEAADRWVELSGDSAVAAWISAKLRVREGRLKKAAELLSGVVDRFPVAESPRDEVGSRHGTGSGAAETAGADRREPPLFIDSLWDGEEGRRGRNQALGELGAVRVARGEFVQALDALLVAGFWIDAAYVAERVLRLGELKTYVDRMWATPIQVEGLRSGAGSAADTEVDSESESRVDSDADRNSQRERIRSLLGRRLMRSGRGDEAAAYLPEAHRPAQARYMAKVREGADPARSARERAGAWMAAAWVARTNGLEILGTEVGPDWAVWQGNFEGGLTPAARRLTERRKVLKATATELRRAEDQVPVPEERFHYRYIAARLAWEAARLMPDHDPETAGMLWTGGTWLKVRDPKMADLFYKALVRRCRKTELGEAADRWRWFPTLDAGGRPHDPPARVAPADRFTVPVPEEAETDPREADEPERVDPVHDASPDPVQTP